MSDGTKLLGFMPWLQLKETVSVAGFSFVPFTVSGTVPNCLEGLKDILPTILSSYVKANKRPQTNCVIVVDETANNRQDAWNITESRIEAAHDAASLLFLGARSKNEYFTPIGSYVNSINFSLYFQRFDEPVDFIAFRQRRRDGGVNCLLMQGSICFTKPLNGSESSLNRVQVDLGFLRGLSNAYSAGSSIAQVLRVVMPLVLLANTDSDLMSLEAEAALMAFAFEQYFGANKARELAEKFDNLLVPSAVTPKPAIDGHFKTGQWKAART